MPVDARRRCDNPQEHGPAGGPERTVFQSDGAAELVELPMHGVNHQVGDGKADRGVHGIDVVGIGGTGGKARPNQAGKRDQNNFEFHRAWGHGYLFCI